MNTNSQKFNDLVAKLKEIFELDKPELDFGVYRIMQSRAAELSDFLENRLAQKVRDALNTEASAEDNETLVYADLLKFFSRYYDKGDFISKRRYKGDVYALPYAGEEVKLVWANQDQYYTKTGENFTNYTFKLDDGKRVHFKLIAADTAKDNVKDNDAARCFVLWDEERDDVSRRDAEAQSLGGDDSGVATAPVEKIDGELYIYFQYLKFPKGTKQNELLKDVRQKVFDAMDTTLMQEFNLQKLSPTEKDKKRTVFDRELDRYVAKNTSDYFIHKDLKTFLTRELDFYVKNEMMNLDDIQNVETFKAIEGNLRRIQAFRTIAGELIAFMAQLEEFQKKIWLKKKFVVQCDYCFTLDRVPEELHAEIFANEAQIAEWKRLGVWEGGEVSRKDAKTQSSVGGESVSRRGAETQSVVGDLFEGIDEKNLCDSASLREIKNALMVDTKFFDAAFKAKLLGSIPDLDDSLDGLLIRSENFQALNLLQERYREQVKTAFVDPPYNTEDSEGENDFLYKDCYKDSSWMSMFKDRIGLAYNLLSRRGIHSATISDEELKHMISAFDDIFKIGNRIGMVEWNSTKSVTNKALISMGHTHIPIYAKSLAYYIANRVEFRLPDSIKGFSNPDNDPRGPWKADPFQVGGERPNQRYVIKNPKTGEEYRPNPGNSWKNEYEKFQELMADNRIVFGVKGEAGPQRKRFWSEAKERGRVPKTWWEDLETTTNGTAQLKNLFGQCPFKNPKPVNLLERILCLCAKSGDIVLDYFAGSGTTAEAVIRLNRNQEEDEGKRKYILVEMGDHFETVVKPRIEKVVYSPEWKDGKPLTSEKGISHAFKYLTLESYEDALNNLELKKADGADLFGALGDEYLLKYMLDIESRGSFLSTKDFEHPFDYTLKVSVDSSGASEPRKVDLVETFNYLLGLKVDRIHSRVEKEGYLTVSGYLRDKVEPVLIVWRDCERVDSAKLNEILKHEGVKPGDTEFAAIFVNGDHAIPNQTLEAADDEEGGVKTLKVCQIESEFLTRMFEV